MIEKCSVLCHLITGVQCALLLGVATESAVGQEQSQTAIGQRRDATILPPAVSPPMLIFRELPESAHGAVNGPDGESADYAQRQARGRWLRDMQPTDPEHNERPRMSREERRQLRQDIRQAGYQVYPMGDSPRRGRSGDPSSADFLPPNRPGRP